MECTKFYLRWINSFLIPQNSKILTEKLQMLIEQPNLSMEIGEKGLQKYEDEFTLDIFEKRLVSIMSKTVIKC